MKAEQAVINRIKQMCKERKISVNRLANISGIAPSTIKNILYGVSKNAGIVTIAKICDGLDISLREFFDDEMFERLEPEIY